MDLIEKGKYERRCGLVEELVQWIHIGNIPGGESNSASAVRTESASAFKETGQVMKGGEEERGEQRAVVAG